MLSTSPLAAFWLAWARTTKEQSKENDDILRADAHEECAGNLNAALDELEWGE